MVVQRRYSLCNYVQVQHVMNILRSLGYGKNIIILYQLEVDSSRLDQKTIGTKKPLIVTVAHPVISFPNMQGVKGNNVVVNYPAVVLQQHIVSAIGIEHWNQKIKEVLQSPLCAFLGVTGLVASVPWYNYKLSYIQLYDSNKCTLHDI